MITTKNRYNVTCNQCLTTLPTYAESPRLAREEAEKLGWKTVIHTYGEKHYCPHCASILPEKEYYGG